ncbi:hypothetical protein GCM10009077_40960 [Roseibium denhamense]
MVVVEVIDGQAKTASGAELDLDGPVLLDRMRNPDSRFETVLLGKDTGIKLRSAEPVPPNDLFGTIDRMPMRQQEMRAREQQNQ